MQYKNCVIKSSTDKMMKIRRTSKYYIVAVIAITILYFVVVILLSEPKEYTDNKLKL